MHPPCMITTRSHVAMTSAVSSDTTITAIPWCCQFLKQIVNIVFSHRYQHQRSVRSGSEPSRALSLSARASTTFCRLPPERVATGKVWSFVATPRSLTQSADSFRTLFLFTIPPAVAISSSLVTAILSDNRLWKEQAFCQSVFKRNTHLLCLSYRFKFTSLPSSLMVPSVGLAFRKEPATALFVLIPAVR